MITNVCCVLPNWTEDMGGWDSIAGSVHILHIWLIPPRLCWFVCSLLCLSVCLISGHQVKKTLQCIEDWGMGTFYLKQNTLHILQLSIAPEIGSDVKLRNQPSWSINQGETRQAKVEPRPTPTVFCSLCPAPSFPSKQFHMHMDADAKGGTWNEMKELLSEPKTMV